MLLSRTPAPGTVTGVNHTDRPDLTGSESSCADGVDRFAGIIALLSMAVAVQSA
jgi:hypothetical protein